MLHCHVNVNANDNALSSCGVVQICLEEGGFNVNEIGSVHQVFTEDEGCILLVLGAGANVTIEPEQYPVTEHPFMNVTVAGTSGWQGQKGGALAAARDSDDGDGRQ